ncbi:MAG: YihA family ribosome biogenesis GTP-binding protein [Muribaculaceae bacterium]|nr:YihA family ribosome biogenesis GTP-binding protein [Muribaculaceae bacterium]
MEVHNAKFEISNADVAKCPAHGRPEYAFIGRSNVGKSSLINMLAKKKGLAKTSQTPGKTLLINHFSINDGKWYIVDLPGYGYASRGMKQREEIRHLIESYILHSEAMTCLFVLIDIRHEPQKIDLDFIEWLGENGIPFAIVFTKADKLSKSAAEASVNRFKDALEVHWEILPKMFVTSSEKGAGRTELLDYIDSINKDCAAAKKQEDEPES